MILILPNDKLYIIVLILPILNDAFLFVIILLFRTFFVIIIGLLLNLMHIFYLITHPEIQGPIETLPLMCKHT